MPHSYRSRNTQVQPSAIHGRGLFARSPIAAGETVAIKGGHIFDRETLRRVQAHIDESYLQIDDDGFIGALAAQEVEANKLFINHSCAPNLGLRGSIAFVALREIDLGEELTYDWAMEDTVSVPLACRCGATICRGSLDGEDWRRPELQVRYRGYFSDYIQRKIDAELRR